MPDASVKLNPLRTWSEVRAAQMRLSQAASVGVEATTSPEAIAMLLKKGAALVAATQSAAITVALKPRGVKTRRNVRKPRK